MAMLRTTATRIPTSSTVGPTVAAVQRARVRSLASSRTRPAARPPSRPSTTTTTTISPDEIAHFSALSANWWDPTGEFGLLHRMNPSRVEFLRDSLLRQGELAHSTWLRGKRVLDVGCGGGIFAESIARLGATTLAIDASPDNIKVAQTHASLDPALDLVNSAVPRPDSLSSSAARPPVPVGTLEYRHCAAEDLVVAGHEFDVVCAMEVIEHVSDPRAFLECLMRLTKPGGYLLLSTINRTPLSKLLTITLAEDVLRLVTPGTHTYAKYLKPDELRAFFDANAWPGMRQRGCVYDPLAGKWRLLGEGVYGGWGELGNYFAGITKPLAAVSK
ncbi:hypothetical protein JCM11491_001619 [Sporobolomyces phaffii]